MPSRIEDYAMIGDCETAALVAKDGSIDWLCWPRFDSSACFAALLGLPENGRWSIAPAVPAKKITRRYRPQTLILETEFETEDGSMMLIDFMPLRGRQSNLVRIVRGVRGQVAMKMELILRFDYGESVPWVTRITDTSIRAISGPNKVVLRSSVPIHGEDLSTVSEFTVAEGQSIPFVLSYTPSHLPSAREIDPMDALDKTEQFWRKWSSMSTYQGPWAEEVNRSLITLKALTYWPTGGIVAAPTTSLPEKIGGERNWDYRICWLRDASFTLWVLTQAGYYQEAIAWQNWLLRAVAGSPDQVQIMYGLGGEKDLREWELNKLPGYEGSKPVRVGNAAAEQLQLDIYGEIVGLLHYARGEKLLNHGPNINLEWNLLNHLTGTWREPDDGIWEVRGPRRQFTHSKVMCWYAFDSAIKSCERFGLKGSLDRWRECREEIHTEVCRSGFDIELGSFVQSYGSKEVDASLLLIPRTGFLPVSDEKVQGTIRAVEKMLMRNGYVLRYNTKENIDGLPPGEGVFLPCSFWLADNYFISGRYEEGKQLLERLMRLRNDVGLFSEEYSPSEQRQVGNFPQAFTHVAFLNSIFISKRVYESSRGK
ncbi:MAG TPA: glycoside hydrolase family 15 protein [Candidatus Saccharimonadales bacterium]|jgi:GH15 family glucan-1,4-alpha-glucosidase|nr:glycoside hydrolase family 15 protein [Candidatus Saccharimonadales bacterium]